jgi:hypothetical protein
MSNVIVLNKYTAKWGTYGKGGFEHCAGRCPEHQLRYKSLVDCDTDHLQMILKNQRQVDRHPVYKSLIHEILIERGEVPEPFSQAAEDELFRHYMAALKNFPVVQSGIGGTRETRQEG